MAARPAVEWDTLLHLLHALSEVHGVTAGSRPPLRPLRCSMSSLTVRLFPLALPFLFCGLLNASSADGCAPAFAQEALLQLFLGDRMAA